MYIADLFTAHCDSLTELNAQGMNAEVRLRRRDHECCFTAQTCVRGPGPSLHKMIFANDKGCDDNEMFDLNIDERIIVVHYSTSKAYQGYTKNGHVFIDESRRI